MIGGKTVGVFISDVRSDVTQVYYYILIYSCNNYNKCECIQGAELSLQVCRKHNELMIIDN